MGKLEPILSEYYWSEAQQEYYYISGFLGPTSKEYEEFKLRQLSVSEVLACLRNRPKDSLA